MQVLQEQWKQAGIDVALKVVDHPTFHRMIRQDVSSLVIYNADRYPKTAQVYYDQFYAGPAAIGKPGRSPISPITAMPFQASTICSTNRVMRPIGRGQTALGLGAKESGGRCAFDSALQPEIRHRALGATRYRLSARQPALLRLRQGQDARGVRRPLATVMSLFVLRRALSAFAVIWCVATLVFLAMRVIPADPAQVVLGDTATQQSLTEFRQKAGLDRPLIAQYETFIGGVVHGDLETPSLRAGRWRSTSCPSFPPRSPSA